MYFLDAKGNYISSGFGPTEFAALAAEGIATFVSSGDSGAQGCAADSNVSYTSANCVNYPASDVSVTAVGGVTRPLNNAGRFVGPLTAWGTQTQFGADGSGGGVSEYVPQPSWQIGSGIRPVYRNLLPDVSLEADTVTGVDRHQCELWIRGLGCGRRYQRRRSQDGRDVGTRAERL